MNTLDILNVNIASGTIAIQAEKVLHEAFKASLNIDAGARLVVDLDGGAVVVADPFTNLVSFMAATRVDGEIVLDESDTVAIVNVNAEGIDPSTTRMFFDSISTKNVARVIRRARKIAA